MGDPGDTGAHSGFLPPEPAGPEPDLEARPAPATPHPVYHGYAPPAEHKAHAPPPTGAAGGYQPGWVAQSPGGQPQQWGYGTPPAVPDNGSAVAGFSLALTSAGLLLLSAGASSIISVVCAGLGIHFSRKGRARVDRGETPKHRGLAQAGFVIGIVSLVLALLATIFWGLYVTDEEFRENLDDELDDGDGGSPDGFETSLRVASAALRTLAALIG